MILEKGSRGSAVQAIQEILNFLHFAGRKSASADFDSLETDGIFGADTEEAVLSFQADSGLYEDGRVGPVTLAALEKAFETRQRELSSPLSLGTPAGYSLESCATDGFKFGKDNGYRQVRLRNDVMSAYGQVSDEVHRQGGLMTSSGGIRILEAAVNKNRSATSFHYSGRALDLFIWSGMQDPAADAYVVQRVSERRYNVYARCWQERAEKGALPPQQTITDVVTNKNRSKGVPVTDHFLDLTALFAKNGFKPIRARAAFEKGGDYLGAEWWHFQWEVGLVPGVSTFGAELQKIYPKSALVNSPPWAYRDYVWQQDWF
ncbi:peptidoglycan-binding domain-containing protein [Agrobacterium arsenijevicii]|uniref:peptidoglycan-binding domain-containing protein n=1 Tax=Agrobacterium arsenijevicii TaxID=1585697 RepID=UPI00069859A6